MAFVLFNWGIFGYTTPAVLGKLLTHEQRTARTRRFERR
jgi:TPP-dependent 2-oxoacid decarboxylase